jgi:hypothetical protein
MPDIIPIGDVGRRLFVFTRSGHVIQVMGRGNLPLDAKLYVYEGEKEWRPVEEGLSGLMAVARARSKSPSTRTKNSRSRSARSEEIMRKNMHY